jgi:hypothetical protein
MLGTYSEPSNVTKGIIVTFCLYTATTLANDEFGTDTAILLPTYTHATANIPTSLAYSISPG